MPHHFVDPSPFEMAFEIAHGRVISKLPTALPQNGIQRRLRFDATNRSGLNDVASGKLSSNRCANRILNMIAVFSGITQSPNRIRYFGAARTCRR